MSINIADYDKSSFDYIRFWQSRQYENQSERMALAKLLPKAGDALVDLGGGFGRLADLYSPHFSRCVLLDYSEKNLDQAKILAETKGFSNLEIKRGDVYDLPFKNDEFDTVLMIRVIHHLLKSEKAIAEVARILKPGGIFILEFANKIHLKAYIRAWLRRDWDFTKNLESISLDTKTTRQPDNPPTSPRGSRGGRGQRTRQPSGILINYHPKHIQEMLKSAGFTIEKKISVSNLRLPVLKKIIPLPILLFLEGCFQSLSCLFFSHFYLGPSIFFRCRKLSN